MPDFEVRHKNVFFLFKILEICPFFFQSWQQVALIFIGCQNVTIKPARNAALLFFIESLGYVILQLLLLFYLGFVLNREVQMHLQVAFLMSKGTG